MRRARLGCYRGVCAAGKRQNDLAGRNRVFVTWVSLTRAFVRERWSVGRQFAIDEVYRELSLFEAAYPRNRHVKAKLRQVLQALRDEGSIEFVDNAGLYRRVR